MNRTLIVLDDIVEQTHQLRLLGKDIDSRIEGVLIRSYMSLPNTAAKELFLHIAYCFKRWGENNVHQESPKFPLERSRVWLGSDSYNILRKGMGSKWVYGLALDMKMLTGYNFTLKLMEVGRLTPDWFRILVGDTIDYTEVRGWRKTGRLKQVNDPSFTELKIVRCIINGPELGQIISGTRSELIDEEMEEIYEKQYDSGYETVGHFVSTFDEITMEESDPYSHEQKDSEGMSKTFVSDEIRDSTSPPQGERLKSVVTHEVIGEAKKKIVLAVNLSNQNKRQEMMNALSALQGIEFVSFDETEGKVTVIGVVDPRAVLKGVIKIADTQIISFGPASERSGFETGKDDKPPHESEKEDEAYEGKTIRKKKSVCSVM
ncbi:hypothetical protein L1987_64787 [Smallanthus sonchifolius]|uniref:Uncharacterized protein n=1 Tax=Smallanthus sonchifolius TaxID=185202 RepID=A0ACB9BSN7_9ASTR|nr:hypothetical protein L1987_64787 [Smallanthus sonchifolius]